MEHPTIDEEYIAVSRVITVSRSKLSKNNNTRNKATDETMRPVSMSGKTARGKGRMSNTKKTISEMPYMMIAVTKNFNVG